jgi:hypothetical protein
MAKKVVRLWYDPEGDYNDAVMEKVDHEGNILGFSVLKVSQLQKKPLEVALT